MLTDLALWIAFRDTPGLRRDAARQLLERYGEPAQIFGRPPLDLGDLCPARAARALWAGPGPLLESARAELRLGERSGLRLLHRGEPDFPALLAEIPDAPLLLWLRGRLPDPEFPVVAIVGSRRPSESGVDLAQRFASRLVEAGAAIVSGLAYGIDAAAHRGALEAAGSTFAVLASGLNRPSPAGNRRLAREILTQAGGWLSEYPPDAPALPGRFPERNRLISGIARATLVVEARTQSGSLWTARHANEQGREVLVVPGPIDTERHRGSNELFRDGAIPILDTQDLLDAALPATLRDALRRSACAPVAEAMPTEDAARILAALADGPVEIDALGRGLRLSPPELAALLLDLELAGRITRSGARVRGTPG